MCLARVCGQRAPGALRGRSRPFRARVDAKEPPHGAHPGEMTKKHAGAGSRANSGR